MKEEIVSIADRKQLTTTGRYAELAAGKPLDAMSRIQYGNSGP